MSTSREQRETFRFRMFTSGSPTPLLDSLDAWLSLNLIDAIDITGVTIGNSTPTPLQQAIRLEISTTQPTPELLSGLQAWATLGLLSNTKLVVDVTTSTSHTDLLHGLDTLASLGLLSHDRMQELGHDHLTCALPAPTIALNPTESGEFAEADEGWIAIPPLPQPALPQQPAILLASSAASTTPSPSSKKRRQREQPPRSPNIFATMLPSLMAELSVRWLLFLGVFLVILSSGVLAASQWQRFPGAGQYLILLAYTLVFWATSLWTSRQPGLTLTAQTLRLVVLLLVPINFWAMDSFSLWQSPLSWMVAAVAAIVLSGATWQLFQFQPAPRRLPLANHLGLSLLHWGWGISGLPLIAVYVGIIATVLLTMRQTLTRMQEVTPGRTIHLPVVRAAVIISALLILLSRAIFVAAVPAGQLGLAVGICGFLMAWLDWQYRPERLRLLEVKWESIGIGGLVLGWLLALYGNTQIQVVAVLALAGWVAWQRLVRSWQRRDLFFLFSIGLHAFYSGWLLIPATIRMPVVRSLARLARVSDQPDALLSVGLLPYVALIVVVTGWLYRHEKPQLAKFGEGLALVLGSIVLLVSLYSPVLQTLTLAGSTALLSIATRRRLLPSFTPDSTSDLRGLMYLTHAAGLGTLFSALHWAAPTLGTIAWASVLLGVMVVEWGMNLLTTSRNDRGWLIWLESAWYIGLGLSTASYLILAKFCFPLLFTLVGSDLFTNLTGTDPADLLPTTIVPAVGLLWLITPLMLTTLASRPRFPKTVLAGGLSVVAIGMAQTLTLGFPGIRLLGLAAGLGLMLVNTSILRHWLAAGIAVGLGLAIAGTALVEGRLGVSPSLDTWLLALAIALTMLWLLKLWLNRYDHPLAQLYGWALDAWAILVCCLELGLLLTASWQFYGALPATSVLLTAGALTMIAPAYRSWQPPRPSSSLWLSIIALSITQLALVGFSRTRLVALAIATVLMLVHTHFLRKTAAATITIGYVVALLAAALWELPYPTGTGWLLAGSLTTGGLWLGRDFMRRQSHPLARVYVPALDGWAIAFWTISTVLLSIHSVVLHQDIGADTIPSDQHLLIAAILNVCLLAYRGWQSLSPVATHSLTLSQGNDLHSAEFIPTGNLSGWTVYGLAWSLEVAVVEVLGLAGPSPLNLAIANIALGLLTQLLGDWWQRRRPADAPPMPSLNVVPLVYAALGASLRWGQFTNWTGLTTIGLSLVAIGIGKRRPGLKPLVYLGMAGFSLGLYECLLFQLLQMKGDYAGDGLIALAAMGATIAYAYRLLSPWLQHYLEVTKEDVDGAAHLHWGLSSLLLAGATLMPISLYPLWFGVGLLLVRYAFFQGRHQPQPAIGERWVWIALAQALGIVVYGATTPIGAILYQTVAPLLAAIACLVAYLCQRIPWATWGWQARPLLLTATILPLLPILPALQPLYPPSFLISAAFYGFLAWERRQIRFTYLSFGLLDLLLWCWLNANNLRESGWYGMAIGASMLYIVQVEPAFKPADQRDARFTLRLLGAISICALPLLRQTAFGLLPAGLGLAAILAGLALRVRAYLFVGAATFLLTMLYQSGVLVFEYPITKWILGLLVGILMLYVGATFETRREQTLALMRQWLTQLETWE